MDEPTNKTVKTFCYQCVAGPDLMEIEVENGVATRIESLYGIQDAHPGGGRVCVCLLYTSPSPRDQRGSRMPSSA